MNATIVRVIAALMFMQAAASAQSLADVARKEEARRKTVHAPGKVYTNGSLHADPAPPPAAGSSAASSAPDGKTPVGDAKKDESKKDAPAKDDDKKDEAYWKQRLDAERQALGRAQTFADALQSRINVLSTDFVNRDDPAQRGVIASDRQKALAELERVRQEIQQHTKAITDIQEEGRKAGVPAGWLR